MSSFLTLKVARRTTTEWNSIADARNEILLDFAMAATTPGVDKSYQMIRDVYGQNGVYAELKVECDALRALFVPEFLAKDYQFRPFLREEGSTMSDTVIRLPAIEGRPVTDYIIAANGNFYDPVVVLFPPRTPIPLADFDNNRGIVIRDGAELKPSNPLGTPACRAYVEFLPRELARPAALRFGLGDPDINVLAPPIDGHAMANLIAIIVGGTQHDDTLETLVCPGVMALNQYRNQNNRTFGKNILAYNTLEDLLVVLIQRNETDGVTLDAISDWLDNLGFDNAVGFDGSTSVFWYNYNTADWTGGEGQEFNAKDPAMSTGYIIGK